MLWKNFIFIKCQTALTLEILDQRITKSEQPPKQVKQEKKQLTLEELDTRLQKLEKVLFGD